MVSDQGSVGCGQWSGVSGLWSVVSGQGSVGCGQWSGVSGLWAVKGKLAVRFLTEIRFRLRKAGNSNEEETPC